MQYGISETYLKLKSHEISFVNHTRFSSQFFITVTSQMRWRLKSPASLLFTQLFVQAQIKENVKTPRYWPLLRYISDGYPILYSHPESYLVLSWQTSLKLIMMYHIAHNTTWNKICHVMRNLMKYILLHSISQKCQVKPHVNLEM